MNGVGVVHAEELHEDGRDEVTDDEEDLKSVDLEDQAF